jgi:hypothetical protein
VFCVLVVDHQLELHRLRVHPEVHFADLLEQAQPVVWALAFPVLEEGREERE